MPTASCTSAPRISAPARSRRSPSPARSGSQQGRGREDAEAKPRLHAEEDKKAKEAIEIRNNADNLAYQCEKQLKELGDKIPDDKKTEIEADDRKPCAKRSRAATPTRSRPPTTDLQNKFQSRRAKNSTSRPPPAPAAGAQPRAAGTGPQGERRRRPDEEPRRRRGRGVRGRGRRQEEVTRL